MVSVSFPGKPIRHDACPPARSLVRQLETKYTELMETAQIKTSTSAGTLPASDKIRRDLAINELKGIGQALFSEMPQIVKELPDRAYP